MWHKQISPLKQATESDNLQRNRSESPLERAGFRLTANFQATKPSNLNNTRNNTQGIRFAGTHLFIDSTTLINTTPPKGYAQVARPTPR